MLECFEDRNNIPKSSQNLKKKKKGMALDRGVIQLRTKQNYYGSIKNTLLRASCVQKKKVHVGLGNLTFKKQFMKNDGGVSLQRVREQNRIKEALF